MSEFKWGFDEYCIVINGTQTESFLNEYKWLEFETFDIEDNYISGFAAKIFQHSF